MTADTRTIDDVLSEAAADVATRGVGKTGHNQQQGYRFRPVDEIINAVGPALAKRGVAVTVCFRDRVADRIQSKSGGTLTSVSITGDFTYWWRGQSRTTTTVGEAMDSGDKATNKAMAMATKYAHLLTLCIPVVGSDDADLAAHAAGVQTAPSKSRLDAIEDELDPPPPAPPSGSGDAPAGAVPPPVPAGARNFADYPRTKDGAAEYLRDVKTVLQGCDGDENVAKAVIAEHGEALGKLVKAKDPVIAGNAASLLDYARQLTVPIPGNPFV